MVVLFFPFFPPFVAQAVCAIAGQLLPALLPMLVSALQTLPLTSNVLKHKVCVGVCVLLRRFYSASPPS